MVEVSFITFTRNSAHRLRGLLEHVKDVVDEIIVVDGYSTDGTVDVARSYGARVYQRRPWGFVEPDRMFALKQASYDWILYLDDDERLSSKLKKDLKSLIDYAESNDICAFSTMRVNLTPQGKLILGLFYPCRQIRIFKKDRASYRGIIHELPQIRGKILALPNEYYILHLGIKIWSKNMHDMSEFKHYNISSLTISAKLEERYGIYFLSHQFHTISTYCMLICFEKRYPLILKD